MTLAYFSITWTFSLRYSRDGQDLDYDTLQDITHNILQKDFIFKIH